MFQGLVRCVALFVDELGSTAPSFCSMDNVGEDGVEIANVSRMNTSSSRRSHGRAK